MVKIPIYKTKHYESYWIYTKFDRRIAELIKINKGEWALWVSNKQIGKTDTKKVLMKRMKKIMGMGRR